MSDQNEKPIPHTPPDGFKHSVPILIRWGDMDALAHVNNAKIVTYFETARIRYVHEVCQIDDFYHVSLILAKITVDFKLSLAVGDEIMVYSRTTRLGHKSFDVESIIVRYQDDRQDIASKTVGVLVGYDFHTRQTIPLLDAWRERILAYEPLPPDGG